MTDNILPEEKLLKLIRGDKKPTAKAVSMPPSVPAKKYGLKMLSLNLSTLTFNRIVKIIFLISSIWLIYSFLQPFLFTSKAKPPKAAKDTAADKKQTGIHSKEQTKPYSFYLDGIRGRKIFSCAAAKDTQKSIGTASADLIKDINLVGIISGEEPQAVIEDKKAQKTYYLKKGQYIGELQLEDIMEGKIILNYNGQSYELYL
ncbi:MAG: type II secretion system protein N [Candidatus Omnitrophota bacterium]